MLFHRALPWYVSSPSRRWSSRFSVSGQIVRRRNKLKLELQRSSGHPLKRALPQAGMSEAFGLAPSEPVQNANLQRTARRAIPAAEPLASSSKNDLPTRVI